MLVVATAAALLKHPVTRAQLPDGYADDPITRWMAAGSAIYAGTFLANANWDYRPIFLLLVLPWKIERCRGPLRVALLGSVLIAMNETWLVRLAYPVGHWLTLFCETALALGLSAWMIRRLRGATRHRPENTMVQARPSDR